MNQLSTNAAVISTCMLVSNFDDADLSQFTTILLKRLSMERESDLISQFLLFFANHSKLQHVPEMMNDLHKEATKISLQSQYPFPAPSSTLCCMPTGIIQRVGTYLDVQDCIDFGRANRQLYVETNNRTFIMYRRLNAKKTADSSSFTVASNSNSSSSTDSGETFELTWMKLRQLVCFDDIDEYGNENLNKNENLNENDSTDSNKKMCLQKRAKKQPPLGFGHLYSLNLSLRVGTSYSVEPRVIRRYFSYTNTLQNKNKNNNKNKSKSKIICTCGGEKGIEMNETNINMDEKNGTKKITMMGGNTIANRICNYGNYGNDCGLFYNLFYALSYLDIKADSFDIFDCIPINVIFDKRFANKENGSIEHIKITILNQHACVEEDEWIRNFANNYYEYFVKDCENSIENIRRVNRLILSSNILYPTLIQSLRGNFRSFEIIWCSEPLLITKENIFAIFHNYLECFRMDATHTVKFDIDLKELEEIIEEKHEFLEDGEIRLLNCPKFQQLSLRCTNSKEEDLYQRNFWKNLMNLDLCKNIETLCISDIWYGRNTRQFIDFENGWFMNEIVNSNSNCNLQNLRSGNASKLKHIKMCITKDGTQRGKISLQNSGLILKNLIIMKDYLMSNRNRGYEDSSGIESTDKRTNKNVSFRLETIEIEWRISNVTYMEVDFSRTKFSGIEGRAYTTILVEEHDRGRGHDHDHRDDARDCEHEAEPGAAVNLNHRQLQFETEATSPGNNTVIGADSMNDNNINDTDNDNDEDNDDNDNDDDDEQEGESDTDRSKELSPSITQSGSKDSNDSNDSHDRNGENDREGAISLKNEMSVVFDRDHGVVRKNSQKSRPEQVLVRLYDVLPEFSNNLKSQDIITKTDLSDRSLAFIYFNIQDWITELVKTYNSESHDSIFKAKLTLVLDKSDS